MIEWRDDAVLLATRRHGESAAIVSVLSRSHGRHHGLVPGGAGQKMRPNLQPGNSLAVVWRARLAESLGTMTCEMTNAYAARFFHDQDRLSCLSSACALIEALVPEREPNEALFCATEALLEGLAGPAWSSIYAHWELALLRTLGYGIDLSCCTVSGANDDLAYVSPKSGRAVSRSSGEAYRDKLLALPAFLLDSTPGEGSEILAALRLSGYFLDRYVRTHHSAPLPVARQRLCERLGTQV